MAKKKVTILVFKGKIYSDTIINGVNCTAGYLLGQVIESEFDGLKKRLSLSDGPVDALEDTARMNELAKLYNDFSLLEQELEIDA